METYMENKQKDKKDLKRFERKYIERKNNAYLFKSFLIRNKLNIQTLMIENCGHHIPIEASSAALNFIKKNLKT